MKKNRRVTKIILRVLLCVFTAVLMVAAGALGGLAVLTRGPSPTARDLFVVSMNETSMGILFAKIFLPQDEIDAIIEANSIVPTDADVDPNLVDADADKDATIIAIVNRTDFIYLPTFFTVAKIHYFLIFKTLCNIYFVLISC